MILDTIFLERSGLYSFSTSIVANIIHSNFNNEEGGTIRNENIVRETNRAKLSFYRG